MDVTTKLNSLSATGRIVLAVVALLGVAAVIAVGYHYGALGAAGGIFAVVGGMLSFVRKLPGRTDVNETTADLANDRADRAARDDQAARDANAQRARDLVADRDAAALAQAEADAAGMSDAEFLDSISRPRD